MTGNMGTPLTSDAEFPPFFGIIHTDLTGGMYEAITGDIPIGPCVGEIEVPPFLAGDSQTVPLVGDIEMPPAAGDMWATLHAGDVHTTCHGDMYGGIAGEVGRGPCIG